MKWVRTISLVVIAIALASLAITSGIDFYASDVSATMPRSVNGYTIEALAVNITILQMVMGLVGVFLTLLGVLGWNSIKSAAIERARTAAETEARKTVSEQLLKLRNAESPSSSGLNEASGDFEPNEQNTMGATPAGESE